MATLGELMAKLKGEGADADPLRPEGTGSSPYSGIDHSDQNGDPVAGTYENIAVPGEDDIPDSVKENTVDYLNKLTSGEDDLSRTNFTPIDDSGTELKITDDGGNPLGPTTATFGYTMNFETALKDAVAVFDEGGFFETSAPDGILDKNTQTDGHGVLNEDLSGDINDVLEEIHPNRVETQSIGLTNTRWNRGYYPPDANFNPEDDKGYAASEAGEKGYGRRSPVGSTMKGTSASQQSRYTPDRPYISQDEIGDTFLNTNPMLEPGATNKLAPWRDIENFDKQWDSIKAKPGEYGEGWAEQYEYAQNLASMLTTHNNNTPGFYYQSKQSFLLAIIMKVIFGLIGAALGAVVGGGPGMPNLGAIDNSGQQSPTHEKEFGSSWKTKMDYRPPPPPPQGLGGLLGAVAGAVGDLVGLGPGQGDDFLDKFMQFLNLPFPWNTIEAIKAENGGKGPLNMFGAIIENFVKMMGDLVSADETMINYWGPIVQHFIALMADIEGYRMNRTEDGPLGPLNVMLIPDQFLLMIKNSPIIRFVRAIMNVMEGYFAGGGKSGIAPYSPLLTNFGDDSHNYYGVWSEHPRFRAQRSRTIDFDTDAQGEPVLKNEWFAAQSLQKLPSMYLLPAAYTQLSRQQDEAKFSAQSPNLMKNNKSSKFAAKHLAGLIQANPDFEGTALVEKVGLPASDGNRFTPEEVNAMENMLEAEQMPFYIQDVRTNEIIAFHAFLSSLSDSYSPSFKASSGFGRIEDVQIYEKTTRAISITFTMAAMSKDDMDELYWKLNKLTTLVYPQWSAGTAMQGNLDGEPFNFRQPYSQIPTASPLIRLRIGDIIQNNYSEANMMKLFGSAMPEFIDGTLGPALLSSKFRDAAKKNADLKRRCSTVPVDFPNADGAVPDTSVGGWPIGSVVEVDFTKGRGNRRPLFDLDDIKQGKVKTKPSVLGRWKHDKARYEILGYYLSKKYGKKFNGDHNVYVHVKYVDTSGGLITGMGLEKGVAKATRDGSVKDDMEGVLLYKDITASYEDVLNSSFNTGDAKTAFDEIRDDIAAFEEAAKASDEKTKKFFDPSANPYFQSFESGMGRGLAGIVNSLSYNYKLNEAPFEISPGMRAPTMIEVSLGFTPIHDIAPGLDSLGGNRAPVYPVASSRLGGSSWDNAAKKENTTIQTFEDAIDAVAKTGLAPSADEG